MRPVGAAVLFIVIIVAGCAAGASPSPSTAPSLSASLVANPTEPPPTPHVTSTPSPTPIPTPTPIAATSATFSLLPADPPPDFVNTITCDWDIGPTDSVAIVRMASSDPLVPARPVLRSYADLAAPRTVCAFGDGNFQVGDLIDA